ncbi:MAG: histidine kinase [Rhizobiales bacterium]|nr:histidine kinase [Hyphomicrobiales bacterium]
MPTVFRFVTILAVAAALVYAAMLALAFLVKPVPREMTVPVSIEDQLKQDAPP